MANITRLVADHLGEENVPPDEIEEKLTELDRTLIGRDARVTIPLRSKIRLRDAADILFALAQQLQVISRATHLSNRHALFDAGTAVHGAQRKMNAVFKISKPHGKNRKAGDTEK